MTRKDYVLIAEAIRRADARVASHPMARDAVAVAAQELADALGRDNPRFDRERFLKACGVAS